MMGHKRYLCKIAVFFALACLLLSMVNRVLTPKYYYEDRWPATAGYQGFYQMEKDSVDVLFLGSSCAVSGFSPQVVYDSSGIRSYNLGCDGQSLLTTYYWLKEALRYQKPEVVVIETYFAFAYDGHNALNTPESCTRKAFDNMRWSGVKWEAVHDICKYDESQTLHSYYFPNIRYHTRWMELNENDFAYPELDKHYELKGFAPLDEKEGSGDYTPFCWWDSGDRADMVPLMREYLDRTVELCKENDIRLILTKLPYTECNIAKYNTTADYAAAHDIPYWDFNEEEIYGACGFDYRQDMNDDWHTNIWGAGKVSSYIASRLRTEYGVTGGQDAQWEETAAYYDSVRRDCELRHIEEIGPYIDAISQRKYTVLLAVKGDGTAFMDEEMKRRFRKLGEGLSMDYGVNGSYFAAVHEGKAEEGASADRLSHHGSTRGGMTDFEITSAGYDSSFEGSASIRINDEEAARNRSGINIVVYSDERRRVVDSVCYNGSLER